MSRALRGAAARRWISRERPPISVSTGVEAGAVVPTSVKVFLSQLPLLLRGRPKMKWTRTALRSLVLGTVALLAASGSASAQAATEGAPTVREGRPPFRGQADPVLRRGLFEAWKAMKGHPDPLQEIPESIHAILATSTVGRPSLVINASGQILFTKQFPPAT